MPKRTPLDWEDLERELHAAGVSPEEIEAGARQLLAQARGHQLAQTRKELGLGQKQIAAAMGVSVARVSQIEHGEVTSFEVIARYVEALGGRWTSSPILATGPSGCPSLTPRPPHNSLTASARALCAKAARPVIPACRECRTPLLGRQSNACSRMCRLTAEAPQEDHSGGAARGAKWR